MECARMGLRSHARCHPYPIPQPVKFGHTTGVYDPYSFTSHKNKSVKMLWDGTYGFSSLSEKTRKSNHLQMSLQRQYFLLSYLKTLSVGLARVWTRDLPPGRLALSQLTLPTELARWWQYGRREVWTPLSPPHPLPPPPSPPPPMHGHQGWLLTANQIRYLKYSNVDQGF